MQELMTANQNEILRVFEAVECVWIRKMKDW